jgi:hypothetical protein
MIFYDRVVEELNKHYPNLNLEVRALLSPLLISEHLLDLPAAVLQQAQEIVRAFFQLRQSIAYQAAVLQSCDASGAFNPGNFSALMSYDFHLDGQQKLKLIEINTNASMALVADLLYRAHGIANPLGSDLPQELLQSFREEFQLSQTGDLENIAIVDDHPNAQKLFLEFALYQKLFEQNGLNCKIADTASLQWHDTAKKLTTADGEPIDLVYNRDTDFYFKAPRNQPLREAFLQKSACVSPNSHEYALLADKQRLIDLSQPDFLSQIGFDKTVISVISGALLKSVFVQSLPAEDVWRERKKYFFKPRASYGGKAVYRGSSITKGVFEEIMKSDYVAQEHCPPPTVLVQLGSEQIEMKYDLRFYVYQDRIQQVTARLYRGQLTNSQTLGGGIAAIRFS